MPQVTAVVGVSGSGKSTLVSELAKKYPSKIAVPVAYTTRMPRPGEQDEVDYYFVNRRQYERLVVAGSLITNITYNNQSYGYAKSEFIECLRGNRRILCVTDRMNIEPIKAAYPDTVAIWLDISPGEQQRRLGRRELPSVIEQRLRISDEEREWARSHAHLFRFFNSELNQAELLAMLEQIVFDDK